MVHGPLGSGDVVVGTIALLALDAVRMATALAVATQGGSEASREVLDALCSSRSPHAHDPRGGGHAEGAGARGSRRAGKGWLRRARRQSPARRGRGGGSATAADAPRPGDSGSPGGSGVGAGGGGTRAVRRARPARRRGRAQTACRTRRRARQLLDLGRVGPHGRDRAAERSPETGRFGDRRAAPARFGGPAHALPAGRRRAAVPPARAEPTAPPATATSIRPCSRRSPSSSCSG